MFLEKDTLELLEKFFESRKENTRLAYAYLINNLSNRYKKDIFSLSQAQIDEFVFSIGDKNDRTFNDYTGYLKALYSFYDKNNNTDRYSMVCSICRKRVDYDRLANRVPLKEELDKVLFYLQSENDFVSFLPLLMVFKLGLTTGDIEKMTNDQVLTQSGQCYIVLPKIGQLRERKIPVPDDIVKIIVAYNNLYGRPLGNKFFVNKRGKDLSARVAQKYLKEACIGADVKPFSLNDVRNLGIPYLLASGKSREDVSKMTGTGTEWYGKYDELVSKYHGEQDRKIQGVKELFPMVESGKMTKEKVFELLGIAPWEVDEIIKAAEV